MEATHQLETSSLLNTSAELTRSIQQKEMPKKNDSLGFILGFFVFLYKTAIKP